MKFFLDTAEIKDIRALAETGLIDGVTTNPTLIYKSGRDFKEVIREICDALPDGDVSAEVIATDTDGMIEEGKRLAEIAENVVVKLPLTLPGISACSALAMEGIRVNVTLCFSPAQAILAAKAGAAYVSPFVGRLDDVGNDGMALIREIVTIFSNYPEFDCEVLAASVRHPQHVVDCAKVGAHVVTLPPSVFSMLFNHPLTDKGLSAFLNDWAKTNQKV